MTVPSIALSSEVETGSREENASKQEAGIPSCLPEATKDSSIFGKVAGAQTPALVYGSRRIGSPARTMCSLASRMVNSPK
jgi:hypothetical protein